MQHSKYISLAVIVAMVAACTEPNGAPAKGVMHGGMPNKEEIGTVAGVVAGGVLGSAIGAGAGQVAATIGGAALGGFLGNRVGQSLDSADREAHDRAAQRALESGAPRSWKSAENNNHGRFVPQKSYITDDGDLCRGYTQTVYINGHKKQAHGTACRDDEGT